MHGLIPSSSAAYTWGMSSHILCSYSIKGDGHAEAVAADAIGSLLQSRDLAWIHLDGQDTRTHDWLEQEISYLDPFIVSALIAESVRPRVTEIGDGLLVILRGVNLNENADPEDMVAVRIWIDSARIISICRRPLKAVADIEGRLHSGTGPKNAGDFLHAIISRLLDRIQPVLTELDDHTDIIEERVIEDAKIAEREKITEIRKSAITFKRYLGPQRDALSALRSIDLPWITANHKRGLMESYDRILRFVEEVDAIRDRAQIVKEELAAILSDKLNKNMYVLSVISAIFLPLGFLTGLLGINIAGIPGANDENAFAIFCVALLVLVGIQVLAFKKLRWF